MDDSHRVALIDTKTRENGNVLAAPESLLRYQLGNHLDSAVLELDDHGDEITYEEYHPYGTTAYQAGRTEIEVKLKRYRYTGKERDEETGLAYHGARYYAPWLGRWISCDPRPSGDLYVYVRDGPIRFHDPNGKEAQSVAEQIEAHGYSDDAPWYFKASKNVGKVFSAIGDQYSETREAAKRWFHNEAADRLGVQGLDPIRYQQNAQKQKVMDVTNEHQETTVVVGMASNVTGQAAIGGAADVTFEGAVTAVEYAVQDKALGVAVEGGATAISKVAGEVKLVAKESKLAAKGRKAALATGTLSKVEIEVGVAAAPLLEEELAIGKFDDLVAAGSKGDNLTPHHIPSAKRMQAAGVKAGDAMAINVQHPVPGSGGRHRMTFTYGTSADANLPLRDALGKGVADLRRVYRECGIYGQEVRGALRSYIAESKAAFPKLFSK
jgi:RHS repeat-associated protein